MTFVVVLSGFAATVTVLNLLLVIVLVKRVRELDQTVADLSAASPQPLLPTGVPVDEFDTTTVDGEPLSHELLAAGTMVAFFSPSCETCHGHLPGWIAEAGRLPGGREQALAVVRDEEVADEMVKPLAEVARVVVEDKRGPVSRAFGLQATPAFCTIGAAHVIEAHGYDDPRDR